MASKKDRLVHRAKETVRKPKRSRLERAHIVPPGAEPPPEHAETAGPHEADAAVEPTPPAPVPPSEPSPSAEPSDQWDWLEEGGRPKPTDTLQLVEPPPQETVSTPAPPADTTPPRPSRATRASSARLRTRFEQSRRPEFAHRSPRITNPEFAAHIDEAMSLADLTDLPAYTLATMPRVLPGVVERIDVRNPKLVKLLESPPTLRAFGFDLDAGGEAQVVDSRLQRSLTPQDKALALWEDGTLVFAATAGEDFLCWGKLLADRGLQINEAALVESAYLFAELSRRIYMGLKPGDRDIDYRLELRNMDPEGIPISLVPGPYDPLDDQSGANIHSAPSAGAMFDVCHDRSVNPGVVAHSLVAQVYAWFGVDAGKIPYAERPQGGQPAISASRIRW